jgi:hypothetical protein
MEIDNKFNVEETDLVNVTFQLAIYFMYLFLY